MAEPDLANPPIPPETHDSPGVTPDSIAAQLAARIDDLPATGEAGDWAAAAAACEREATERAHGREAALLLHQAGRIHEERLGDPERALAFYERARVAGDSRQPELRLPIRQP